MLWLLEGTLLIVLLFLAKRSACTLLYFSCHFSFLRQADYTTSGQTQLRSVDGELKKTSSSSTDRKLFWMIIISMNVISIILALTIRFNRRK
jgi:hypothetical protein